MTDNDILQFCLRQARKSDCSKLRFGAVTLTDDNRITSFGYNHNPLPFEGYDCGVHCVGGIRRGVKSGTCVERCYAVHAEQHAVINAGTGIYEVAVAGLLPDDSLFDNGGGFYCTVCARIMAQAGVKIVSIWSGGERKRLSIQEAWEQSYSVATR